MTHVRRNRSVVPFFLAASMATLFLSACERTEQAFRGVEVPRGESSLLLVTLDTTRADRLRPYGAWEAATPTLDILAREGIIFDQAFAVAPITLVAHTSILTGLYPPQHGVRNNGLHYVPDEVETLAERLRKRGYRTAAFVSAAVLERRYGLDQGFELYDDDLSTGRERNPRMVPDRPAEATVSALTGWLDGLEPTERFFAWIHFYDPHAPYSPPPPYRDQFRERRYDGEIAYMDAQLGRLLEHPRLSESEEVAVMVVGDHGESLGEHGEQTHAILAHDSTLRVPWIARIPGGPRGLRIPWPVSQVDLLPTVLDLLALPQDRSLPGQSNFLPPVPKPGTAGRSIYSETYLPYYTYGWAKLKVVRQGNWKLIAAPTPELYDLRRDPRELTNVFEQRAGMAHDLSRDLEELLAALGDAERETNLSIDHEAAEKLRSLGYLAAGSGSSRPESERPDPKEFIDLHVGLERARAFLRDRLLEPAVRELRRVLAKDRTNLAALIDLAHALRQQNRIDEAVGIVERAMALDPGYVRLYLVMADLEAQRGQPEQGLELIDQALELDPRYLEARLQKAIQLDRLQRRAEAREILDATLGDHADHPRLNAIYAQMFEIRAGALAAAESRLRRVLELDPFLVLGWRLLGIVLERTGRVEQALECFREGLERRPDDAALHGRLGLLLARLGTGKEAEDHVREAIRLSPQFRADLYVTLGALLAESGRWQEAQREYETVLIDHPRHPGALNNRAIAFYKTGRLEEAAAELKRLVDEYPDNADAHNNLAAVALDRREWAEAEREARRALDLNPRLVHAWNNLGTALDEQGKSLEARRHFRRALELDPRYWQARNNLAVTFRKERRAEAAAALFQEVLDQVPDHPEVHLELADLYAGPLSDPERSAAHYNAFLRSASAHPRAEEVRNRLTSLPSFEEQS